MSDNTNELINNLQQKINIYREFCKMLSEANFLKYKLLSEMENLQADRHRSWFSAEDVILVERKYVDNTLDIEYLVEAVDISLYGIKYAAYRLGRTRSRTRPEP